MFSYRKGFTRISSAVLGVGLLLGAAGCNRQPAEVDTTQTVTPASNQSVTVAEIIGNPTTYVGQTVTVSGEVNRVLNTRSFTLGDEGLLVVLASNLPDQTSLTNDHVVQVNGAVRNFVVKDLESEYGFDLQDDLYVDYANKPAIVAQRVDITTEQTEKNVTVIQQEKPDKDVTVVQPKQPNPPDKDVNIVNTQKTEREVNVVQPKSGTNKQGEGNEADTGTDKSGNPSGNRQGDGGNRTGSQKDGSSGN